MTYQLRIAGSDHRTNNQQISMLTPQAIEMAAKGYGCVLVEVGAPGLGLEITRKGTDVAIATFNNTRIAELPEWIGRAEADLHHQLNRKRT